jgi:tetratricopeptide (TPR) repeat protein
MRSLAKEAGIQPSIISRFLGGQTTLEAGSAIKIYNILHENMNPVDRRTFLRVLGLLPMALALSPDSLLTASHGLDVVSANSHEIGIRLMVIGEDLARHSWVEAIPVFRKAENILGPASSQAARDACRAAQLLTNLGDYGEARKEISQVQRVYGPVMDPETEAEAHRIRGWLDYYQGNLAESETWLSNCLRIAKETGIERIGESAQHFLGRLYCVWGQVCQKEAHVLFHRAQMQFDKAYQLHLRFGTEGDRAFDLFRNAQLLRVQRQWREARQLRRRARQMFGGDLAILHIDLEEARLALDDNEERISQLKAEGALSGWAQINYAKGMACALQVLGDWEWSARGKLDKALELFVAALCIYPFQNNLSNRQLLTRVAEVSDIVHREEGEKNYERLVWRIQGQAEGREGCFSYLSRVSADRSADVAEVLSRLRTERRRVG